MACVDVVLDLQLCGGMGVVRRCGNGDRREKVQFVDGFTYKIWGY